MNKINQLKKELKGKFFTVTFTKKDGTLRKMNARLGVTKHLKGGTKKYDAEAMNYLTVFDVSKKGYRTINLSTVESLKCGKDLMYLVK